jgi:hypothetical protein
MFEEGKNLKDTVTNLGMTIKDTLTTISYTKTDKLITALYMVTDIVDKDEPLRNKLRTLGVEILSDITSPRGNLGNAGGKISELMSFLDIASAVNIISGMNCNILRKEFLELDQSIKESTGNAGIINRQIDLSEYFGVPPLLNKEGNEGRFLENSPHPNPLLSKERGNLNSKGHTHIGVQKGSTLMRALSDRNFTDSRRGTSVTVHNNFDLLKKQRRDDITNFIRKNGKSVTITDIKNGATSLPAGRQGSLTSCSEKTLQRELISMVKDGVLKKTGEKRWSRYFIRD